MSELATFVEFLLKLASAKKGSFSQDDLVSYTRAFIKILDSKGLPSKIVTLFSGQLYEKGTTITSEMIQKFQKEFQEEKDKPQVTKRDPGPIRLVKSRFGNMIHEPTNIVFTERDGVKIAIGVEDEGKVKPLTMKQCVICSQNVWKYNLNSCVKSAMTTVNSDCAVNLEDVKF